MDARLESLLLQTRAAASLADRDRTTGYEYLREAVRLDAGEAAEALFQFHLGEKEYGPAEGVLEKFQSALDPLQLKILRAVLAALTFGRSAGSEILAALQPGPEATWPLLYLGVLQHARGEVAASRATLFSFIDRLAWRKDLGRSLAVEILLQGETRRCRLCRIRKPKTYLQDGTALCSSCAGLPENQRLESFATWYLRRSSMKESRKVQTHFVPILAPEQIVSALDAGAKKVWDRARQIATERERIVTGIGELGTALFEGPFDRKEFVYPRDQERLFEDANKLQEETATGPSRVGDELAWLLNIAHWYRRLFRGSPQFEDGRHKPIDIRLLKAAYTVCRPGPASLMGSSLALVTGFNLSDPQADLFQYLLRKRPDSFFLHIVLSSHHRRIWRPNKKELEHELWLIRHYPFASRSGQHWLSSGPTEHRACVEAWVEAVRKNIDDPYSLGQAASFFRWEYPILSKALIDRCLLLDPGHRAWTGEAIDCVQRVLERARGPDEQRALARECLTYLEPALAHPPAGHTRLTLWSLLARYAHDAQDFARAEHAARKVLTAADATDTCSASARHTAHSVMGLLELRAGQASRAKSNLLAAAESAPPGEDPLAPLWRLTRILWAMRDYEALGEYLSACGRWSESQMAPWLEDMKMRLAGFSKWHESRRTQAPTSASRLGPNRPKG